MPRNRTERYGGFTLIELMTVMFIMAIVVALVVGVGRFVMEEARRKETRNNQAIVMTAVEAYIEVARPYANEPEEAFPSEDVKKFFYEIAQVDNASGKENPTSFVIREQVAGFPPEWTEMGSFPDGWGQSMVYERTGSANGGPVLISPGPDGEFDTADDIRSDGQ